MSRKTELAMKIVGKRQDNPNVLEEIKKSQKLLNQLNPHGFVPRGIYRFPSFKEADRWMIQKMANTHVSLKLKTS